MKKYCDYYFTTQRHLKGEVARNIFTYHYSWHIRNAKGEEIQSSFANEDGEQYYDSREIAEQQAKEAIQDHYV